MKKRIITPIILLSSLMMVGAVASCNNNTNTNNTTSSEHMPQHYDGQGAPANGFGLDGDTYTDTNTGKDYQKQNGQWVEVHKSVELSGEGAPDASLGENGDTYVDTISGAEYVKQNGEWVVTKKGDTTYVVTFNLNGGRLANGATEIPSQTIREGRWVVEPTMNPVKEHCKFLGWYTDEDVKWAFKGSQVWADLELIAKYSVNEDQKITYTVDPNNGEAKYTIETFIGDSSYPKIPSNPGYDFVGWKKKSDGSMYNGTVTANMNGETVIAQWEKAAFNVSYQIEANGEATITGVLDINAQSITIPNTINGRKVTKISKVAFNNRISLLTVYIPENVKVIEEGAFAGARKLEKILVDSANVNYTSVDGVLFTKSLDTLVCYPTKSAVKAYTVPASVTRIASYAFYGTLDMGITSINCSEGLVEIGDYAFYMNETISSLTFPKTLRRIGKSAFVGNTYTQDGDDYASPQGVLQTVRFNDGLEEIGDGAFANQYFKDTFEGGAGNWEGRGAASVKTDSSNYYDGSKSLYVSGRTDNWNGTQTVLDTKAFVPGNSYAFAAAVMQNSESSTGFKMTLQYTDSTGTEQYDEVATATAKSGTWTDLSTTSYKIPAGASNMVLYIEAPDSLTDFYVDTITGSKAGTASTITTGQGTSTTTPTTPTDTDPPGDTVSADSLKGKFGSLFKMGTSVSPFELSSGASFIKKHFNSITPENELKPDSLLKQGSTDNTRCNVSLAGAAQTLKFCEDNGIAMRGHTFVWYSQTPDWFFKEGFQSSGAYVSKDIMNKRLENFIKDTFDLIAKEYPKLDLYAYDVCNELFVNDGGGLRPGSNSNWTKVYGDTNDEFIINAFTYARQYAPKGCKLYINDYNEYIPAKTNDIYNIAMKLKELGVIDGIGMQSHLATNYPSASVYKTGLEKFLSTGLDVQITELDIETKGNDSARAQLFQDVFQMAVDHADQISSFTVWGTHDDISWRKNETPLLFGSNYSPKPDYDKVMSIKVNASVVTTTATTTVAPVITTTTVAGPAVTKYGDANCDGEVNMADAVLIMQYLANPNKYGLNGTGTSHMTAQGLANADVYDSGDGVSSADALSIQKYLLQLVKTLPESVSSQKKTDAVNTTAPTTTKAPTATTVAAGKTLLSNSFENGAGSFEGRGDAAVALDKSSYYTGSQSLFVSGRTDNWNGAAIPLSTSEYVPGTAYSFSAAVMQATGSATDVQMTLQYTLNGEDNYDQIATATAKDKTWTDLSNTSFKIPAGATNLILYVELPDSLGDYYLDDVTIASDGTASKIQTGGGVANPVVTTTSAPSTSGGKVDPSKPMMAISFDDGTSQYGTRIVDALAKEGFRATFFYVGDWIKDTNEIKHAYECGMEIANHTTSHPHLPQQSATQIRSEFDNCYNKLKNIIGAEPSKLMRLPYLESNATVQQSLYDVPLISCSIDTQDWNGASKDQIVNTIKSAMNNGSANGAIILCHETYATTAAAMEEIAPYAKAQGWQIVTISEMFAAKGKQLNGGQVYTKVG